jgi:predicted phage terminase large subunit-like protein
LKVDNDKLTRAEGVLPYIESGNVLLPESETYGFVPDLLNECESFSRDDSHIHDDIVDALVYLIQESLGKAEVSLLDFFMR